jgi:hypothetical protein
MYNTYIVDILFYREGKAEENRIHVFVTVSRGIQFDGPIRLMRQNLLASPYVMRLLTKNIVFQKWNDGIIVVES